MKPRAKLSPSEKQKLIDEFVAERSGKLTAEDIQNCYLKIVNPGYVGKASHALRVCFLSDADIYITECFKLSDRRNELYAIRNAINHGEVDAENPDELVRIRSRLTKLWLIVWQMFGRLVSFPAPVPPSSQDEKND
jgi:hypothetical protein